MEASRAATGMLEVLATSVVRCGAGQGREQGASGGGHPAQHARCLGAPAGARLPAGGRRAAGPRPPRQRARQRGTRGAAGRRGSHARPAPAFMMLSSRPSGSVMVSCGKSMSTCVEVWWREGGWGEGGCVGEQVCAARGASCLMARQRAAATAGAHFPARAAPLPSHGNARPLTRPHQRPAVPAPAPPPSRCRARRSPRR